MEIVAVFEECDFSGANFRGNRMHNIGFVNCTFGGANLSNCKLVSVDLRGSDLSEALCTDLAVSSTSLERVTWPTGMSEADLRTVEEDVDEFEEDYVRLGGGQVTGDSWSGTEFDRPLKLKKEKAKIPSGMRFEVFKRDGFRCVSCGRAPKTHPEVVLHVDHIQPESKGGTTEPSNLQTLCMDCNLGKGNRDDTDLRK